jgi:hypothetical protein
MLNYSELALVQHGPVSSGVGEMAEQFELEEAFDAALGQVERLLRAGMKTGKGTSARPQLEELQRDLKRERENALEHRTIDREWLQKTVRWVVEWASETDITLVAALGRIARARVL